MYAICYTKPGTTLTFWLNRFSWGGFIWSLVRTSPADRDEQRWNQPPLRFESERDGQQFIVEHLGGNPDARVVLIENE